MITVCIPTRNEAGIIESVVKGVKPFADEVLVVDGHSTDGTAEAAQKLGARVVTDHGRGKGDGVTVGIQEAKGDIVVFIDADGSHEPRDIPSVVKPIEEGKADIVIASRAMGGSDEFFMTFDGFFRQTGGNFITMMINLRWKTRLTDVGNGFRALKRGVGLTLGLRAVYFDIEQEMVMKALKKGYTIVEVPSHEYERKWGHSKNGTWGGWRHLVGLFRELLT